MKFQKRLYALKPYFFICFVLITSILVVSTPSWATWRETTQLIENLAEADDRQVLHLVRSFPQRLMELENKSFDEGFTQLQESNLDEYGPEHRVLAQILTVFEESGFHFESFSFAQEVNQRVGRTFCSSLKDEFCQLPEINQLQLNFDRFYLFEYRKLVGSFLGVCGLLASGVDIEWNAIGATLKNQFETAAITTVVTGAALSASEKLYKSWRLSQSPQKSLNGLIGFNLVKKGNLMKLIFARRVLFEGRFEFANPPKSDEIEGLLEESRERMVDATAIHVKNTQDARIAISKIIVLSDLSVNVLRNQYLDQTRKARYIRFLDLAKNHPDVCGFLSQLRDALKLQLQQLQDDDETVSFRLMQSMLALIESKYPQVCQ